MNDKSESLSPTKVEKEQQKKVFHTTSGEPDELIFEVDPLLHNIDYTPHVRVGNLLLFKELVAVELIIPIPVSFFGMLESASARESWGKRLLGSFGDPSWKSGLSWLYEVLLEQLESEARYLFCAAAQ